MVPWRPWSFWHTSCSSGCSSVVFWLRKGGRTWFYAWCHQEWPGGPYRRWRSVLFKLWPAPDWDGSLSQLLGGSVWIYDVPYGVSCVFLATIEWPFSWRRAMSSVRWLPWSHQCWSCQALGSKRAHPILNRLARNGKPWTIWNWWPARWRSRCLLSWPKISPWPLPK